MAKRANIEGRLLVEVYAKFLIIPPFEFEALLRSGGSALILTEVAPEPEPTPEPTPEPAPEPTPEPSPTPTPTPEPDPANIPPHCGGNGSPIGLYPECLRNSSEVYWWKVFSNNIDKSTTTYYNGDIAISYVEHFSLDISFLDNPNGDGWDYWSYRLKGKREDTYNGEETFLSEYNNPDGLTNLTSFTGTFAEMESRFQPMIIDEERETERFGWVEIYTRKQWIQVMAIDPDTGLPVNCNPIGNEGCP